MDGWKAIPSFWDRATRYAQTVGFREGKFCVQKKGEALHPLKLTKGSFTFENRPKIAAKGNSPWFSGSLDIFSLQKTFNFILLGTYRYMSLSSL